MSTSQLTPFSNAALGFLLGDRASKTRPSDYLHWQRENNTYHKDGLMVHDEEGGALVAQYFADIIKKVESPKNSVLDLGCRMGYCLPVFAGAFPAARILGVDVIAEFVEEAEAYGDALVADAQDLPFADNEFDYIFCSQCLEHCHDPQKAVNEIVRVAKYGFLVGIPLEEADSFANNKSHYVYHNNPITWLRLFEAVSKFRLFHAVASDENRSMNFIFLRVIE